jgi:predicted SprT family Zn-dependent metalloprotease
LTSSLLGVIVILLNIKERNVLITHDLDYKIGVENASKIRNEANFIIEKYSLTQRKITIEFSTKMKRSAGTAEAFKAGTEYVIKLSYKYFKLFGIERSIQTLRHEFAHCIQYNNRGRMSHDYEFKVICNRLGGSMAPKMAGETFSTSASTEYIKTEWKYVYICPCGAEYKRARRMNESMRNSTRHSCSKCRRKVYTFKEVKL